MNLYNWLIVMKNGEKLWVQLEESRVDDLISKLYPKTLDSRNFYIAKLITPDDNGNNFVVINGQEVSHIYYKSN